MKKKASWTVLAVLALVIGAYALQVAHMKGHTWKNTGGYGGCDFIYPQTSEGLFAYKCHRSPNGKVTYIPIICIGHRLLLYNATEGMQKGIATYTII